MAINGYAVFDSDLHVIEPDDLWTRYIDPKYRDRAPIGLKDEPFSTGNLIKYDGAQYSPRKEAVQYFEGAVDHCTEQAHLRGRYQQYIDFDRRDWGPDTQIEAMDTEGVDAAVLFPTRGLAATGSEYEEDGLAAAVARAYNDWMAEFCSYAPDRLYGAAMIHPQSVELAAQEVRRTAREYGFKGSYIRPNPVKGRNWHDPVYDPLWAAFEEEQMLVGFHEGYPCTLPFAVAERFDGRHEDWWLTEHVTRHPVEMMYASTCMINGGVLERFPNLRVGFLEANCSWVPYWLWRMDEHYEIREKFLKHILPKKPSSYFLNQCFVSIEADEHTACPVLDSIAENVVFSTDFPHSDSAYPKAMETFMELALTEEQRRKILWDNCVRMYGFTPGAR